MKTEKDDNIVQGGMTSEEAHHMTYSICFHFSLFLQRFDIDMYSFCEYDVPVELIKRLNPDVKIDSLWWDKNDLSSRIKFITKLKRLINEIL